MTPPAPAASPVVIDRVDRWRGAGARIRLRLSGRWPAQGASAEIEPLLVVTIDGRRHRFAAERDSEAEDRLPADRWEATFELPAWAEPTRPGQAGLWMGDLVVSVPLPGAASAPASAPPDTRVAPPSPAPVPPSPAARAPAPPSPAVPAPAAPHPARLPAPPALGEATPGPEDSVTARHGELDQRAAELARLRGEVAEAQSELSDAKAGLADAQAELARERTRGAQEVARLAEQLAAASVARDAASGEVAALQAELQRLGAELAVAREQLVARGGDLGEAERLLADARALAEQLRGEISQ